MTGITKDELMQIMKEAMALEVRSPHVFSDGSLNRAAYVANAILERAAVECEDTDIEEARGGSTYYAQLGDAGATRYSIAKNIRALKINTGD